MRSHDQVASEPLKAHHEAVALTDSAHCSNATTPQPAPQAAYNAPVAFAAQTNQLGQGFRGSQPPNHACEILAFKGFASGFSPLRGVIYAILKLF